MTFKKNPFKPLLIGVAALFAAAGISVLVYFSINVWGYTYADIAPGDVNHDAATIASRYYPQWELPKLKLVSEGKAPIISFAQKPAWLVKFIDPQKGLSCLYFYVGQHGMGSRALYSNFYRPCKSTNPFYHIFIHW